MTDSEFYMWRALFAFALIDQLMTAEKRRILLNAMQSVVLSKGHKIILAQDIHMPKDIEWLFVRIKNHDDRRKFCQIARQLMDCIQFDSAYEEAEAILTHLEHLSGQDGRIFTKSSCAAETACQLYQNPVPFYNTRQNTMEIVA